MDALEKHQQGYQQKANAYYRIKAQELLILFELIAERDHEVLRDCLKKVFDLSDVERGEKHLRGYLNELRIQLNVASSRCASIERRQPDLNELRTHLAALERRLEKLENHTP